LLNDTFIRRTTDLEKIANMNFLLTSLSATTIADRMKITSGRMINYPLYDAIHDKNRLHKRATHASTQSSPKAQFYRKGVPDLSLTMYPLLNFFIEFLECRNYKGRLCFYVSKLICCKRTINVLLQTAKYTPRGTCIPGWEPLLKNLLIMFHYA